MNSDLIDKLLIILMIVLLPVSVFFASNHQKKYEKLREEELAREQMERVTQAVAAIQNQAEANAQKNLEITQVYYATESGKLVIKGTAPKPDQNIMVSAVLSPPGKSKNDTSDKSDSGNNGNNVLGQEVDVVAIKTDENGDFAYVRKIDAKEASLIDIRFDQDRSSATVQFDLQKRKQINDQ